MFFSFVKDGFELFSFSDIIIKLLSEVLFGGEEKVIGDGIW